MEKKMKEFQKRVLGLAGIALVFAGVSFGQITCAANYVTTYAGVPGVNPTLRAEGLTELVADTTLACTNGGAVTTGSTATANLTAPVTGRVETVNGGGTPLAGNSDIVLQVQQPAGTLFTNGATVAGVYAGTVSGNTVSFSGIAYPAGAFVVVVSNARVNASQATAPQITETITLGYNLGGVGNNVSGSGAAGPALVGFVQASLASSFFLNASNNTAYYVGGIASSTIPVCSGVPLSPTAAPVPAFQLLIKELTTGAFKTLAQESGSYPGFGVAAPASLATSTGQPTQATQIQIALANVPVGATVYVPISSTAGGTTLTLTGSPTALATPASVVRLPTGIPAGNGTNG